MLLDWSGCQRANTFYVDGGVLCKSIKSEGSCTTKNVILAVNMNGQETTDSRGISYVEDMSKLYADPFGTRFPIKISNHSRYFCKEPDPVSGTGISGITPSEVPLFSSLVAGSNTRRGQGRCLSYPINVTLDGVYELVIKSVETFHVKETQRMFDVVLNNRVILQSFNIRKYVPPCTAIDVVTLFQIQNRLITIIGYNEPTAIEGSTINLSFCYGSCQAHDPNYLVAAFSVVLLSRNSEQMWIGTLISRPPLDSALTCKGKVNQLLQDTDESKYFLSCKRAGCEVDVATRQCISEWRICKPASNTKECRRKNYFYGHGGVICKSGDSHGSCEIDKVLAAVNLNGIFYSGGSENISYVGDGKELYVDPLKSREPLNGATSKCAPNGTVHIAGIPEGDNDLFATEVFGKSVVDGSGICLTYPISLKGEGHFELGVKMAEIQYDAQGIRHFRLSLNKLVIAEELDVTRYVSTCHGFNLVASFEVKGNLLHMTGYRAPVTIVGGNVSLSFCYGGCRRDETCDPSYIGSAFYLAKLKWPDEDDSKGNGTNNVTTPIGPPIYPPSTPAPQIITTDPIKSTMCGLARVGDECDCYAKKCEYNRINNECALPEEICPDMGSALLCLRPKPNVFYSYGSIVCKSSIAVENCPFQEIIMALNLGGTRTTDERKIVYESYFPIKEIPDLNNLNTDTNFTTCANTGEPPNVLDTHRDLYSSRIYTKTDLQSGCVSFPFRLTRNGRYELSIKTMEPDWNEAERNFDILLNGEIIQRAFGIQKYVGSCNELDLSVQFTVENEMLTIMGKMKSTRIWNGKVSLNFCLGSCPSPDRNIALNALSVVRLGDIPPVSERCEEVNLMQGAFQECHCRATKGELCEYSFQWQMCGQKSSICPPIIDGAKCLRKNSYYIYAGVICSVDEYKDNDECYTEKPLIAVNVNGQAHIDHRGISYRADTSEDYTHYLTSRTTFKFEDTKAICKNLNPSESTLKDAQIYYSGAKGASFHRNANNCISYPIQIKMDGEYELGLKFLQFSGSGMDYFNVFLNDQLILSRFNIYNYVGLCNGMEIFVHFTVKNGSLLEVKDGSGVTTSIVDDTVKLSVCYGDSSRACSGGDGNPDYLISGFYVARFGEEPLEVTCAKINERFRNDPLQSSKCKEAGCEMDLNTRKCATSAELCRAVNDVKCLSANTYFAYGGVVCPIKEDKREDCYLNSPLLAININGAAHTDGKGIRYRKEEPTDYITYRENNEKSGFSLPASTELCKSVEKDERTKADRQLYYTFLHGTKNFANSSNCIRFKIELGEDPEGEYELMLRFFHPHLGIGYSYFDVFLTDRKILSDFDISSYVGRCKGMDVSVQFTVSTGMLYLKGMLASNAARISDQVTLSFCYSDVAKSSLVDGGDPSYSVSGFHLSKFREKTLDDTCMEFTLKGKYPRKECECREVGCEYWIDSDSCVAPQAVCTSIIKERKCVRENSVLNQGGINCPVKSFEDKLCYIGEVIKAVNVYGQDHVDKRGIQFKKEVAGDYVIPFTKTVAGFSKTKSFEKCKTLTGSTPPTNPDSALYFTMQWSLYQLRKPSNCLSYPIPIVKSGEYELGLKFVNVWLTKSGTSFFNVFLNGQKFLSEFDVLKYAKACTPLEIYAYFSVEGNALQMEGKEEPSVIVNNTVSLSLCYGDFTKSCERIKGDSDYYLSAFHVARLVEPPLSVRCAAVKPGILQESKCKLEGCEFNIRTQKCGTPEDFCPNILREARCIRRDTFYANAGFLCKVEATNEKDLDCKTYSPIVAFNLNGEHHTGRNGISFKKDSNLTAAPFRELSSLQMNERKCQQYTMRDATLIDEEIYLSVVRVPESSSPTDCIVYSFEVAEEGEYELGLKLFEADFTLMKQNGFNVLLNNRLVLSQFNILNYVPVCNGMDVMVHFKVELNGIYIAGYDESDPLPVVSPTFLLSFCNGDVGRQSSERSESATASAFYVSRYKPSNNSEVCQRVRNGTNKQRRCKWSGSTCEYSLDAGNCIAREVACPEILSKVRCKREHSFYAHGGIICKVGVVEDIGECYVTDPIKAVNINGGDFVDFRGITYKMETAGDYERYRNVDRVTYGVADVDKMCESLSDEWTSTQKDLYYTMVRGLENFTSWDTCLKYTFPVSGDGEYELVMKFLQQIGSVVGSHFSVLLNGREILSQFDILRYVDVCSGMDVNVHFNVTGTRLYIGGFDDLTSIAANQLQLSFCYGDSGGSLGSAMYTMSGFYVAKFRQGSHREICQKVADSRRGNKECRCRKGLCQTEMETGKCISPDEVCPDILQNLMCTRENSFVAAGGTLCSVNSYAAITTAESCILEKPLIALNMNGVSSPARDWIGIEYRADVPDDYLTYRNDSKRSSYQVHHVRNKCGNITNEKTTAEKLLYYTVVRGTPYYRDKSNCVRYKVKISEDGKYELGLKFLEAELQSSLQEIHLNGQTILTGFVITNYVARCIGMDVIVHFKIVGGKMFISGFEEPTDITLNTVHVSFCYGDKEKICRGEQLTPDYTISAFYVARYKEPVKKEICDKVEIHYAGRSADSDKECTCKAMGCEFSEGECMVGSEVCEFLLSTSSCLRPNTFYAYGGVVCKNSNQTAGTLCHAKKVIAAYKVGRDAGNGYYVDSRGVEYKSDTHARIIDPQGTRGEHSDFQLCTRIDSTTGIPIRGIPILEKDLYISGVYGKDEKRMSGGCLSYLFNVTQNGIYEITIKTVETRYTSSGVHRYFNIKINNMVVLSSFSPTMYVPSCTGMDLVIELRITNGSILVQGFQNLIKYAPKTPLQLTFCYGTKCPIINPNYSLRAFSVVLLGEESSTLKPRARVPKTEEELCREVAKGDQCTCGNMNCQYNLEEGECTHMNLACGSILQDARCLPNGTFYAESGVLCKVTKPPSDDCPRGSPAIAINIAGSAKVDWRGIPYRAETPIDYYETGKVLRSTLNPCRNSNGDGELYRTMATGNGEDSCLHYPIRDLRAGDYEFGFKTFDSQRSANHDRRFDIKINGILVISKLNVQRLGGTCKDVEIITHFRIERGILSVKGFKETSKITKRTVTISFCSAGDSSCSIQNPDFIVSAFHVMRMAMVSEKLASCNEFQSDKCECLAHECQYNSAIGVCSSIGLECDESMGQLGSFCKFPQSFDGNGGSYCKNTLVSDFCGTPETILAVNLNGGAFTDMAGISYQGDNDVPFLDPFGLRATGKLDLEGECDEIRTIHTQDTPLYQTYIYGNISKSSTSPFCLSYNVPVLKDGTYQINVKALETTYTESRRRYFTIEFNDVAIFSDIDLALISGDKCQAVEFSQNFNVMNNGNEMIIKGYSGGFLVKNRQALLSFCPGGCTEFGVDLGFVVSAFSVQQMTDESPTVVTEKSTPPLTAKLSHSSTITQTITATPNPTEKIVLPHPPPPTPSSTTTITTTTTQGPTPSLLSTTAEGPEGCSRHKTRCECAHQENCMIYTNKTRFGDNFRCITVVPYCNPHFFHEYECRRNGSFYGLGHSVCLYTSSTATAGNCNRDFSDGAIFAINLNGYGYMDSNGIWFGGYNETMRQSESYTNTGQIKFQNAQKDGICRWAEPYKRRKEGIIINYRGDMTKTDIEKLLFGYIFGSDATRNPNYCSEFSIPLIQDGLYELNIKCVEMVCEARGLRQFDVVLNERVIFSQVDLYRLAGQACMGVDMMVNFRVWNDVTVIDFFGRVYSAPIKDKKLKLKFCYSECKSVHGNLDTNYVASAFSVMRLTGLYQLPNDPPTNFDPEDHEHEGYLP